MIFIEIVDCLLTAWLVPFVCFMGLIVLAAVFGSRSTRSDSSGDPRTFLIVIPAHDEEGVIASTVQSCRGLDYPLDRFSTWVIADNCTDQTARVAREAGASVVERSTPDLRSKGHALEYFFTQIPEGRPDSGYDAVVLIDADTVVDPELLNVFDAALAEGLDWIQGYYTVRNPDASWRTRLMTHAFSLANGVWMVGLERLGLSVGLKGNGMCFSSRGLRRFPWRAHGLVEDMEFALMLRAEGERVRFRPEARVFGEMVSRGGAGAASQRQRWEAGRRSLRTKFAGLLARSRSLGPAQKAMALIDLFFPPLASMALALGLVLGIDLLIEVLGGPTWPVRSLELVHSGLILILGAYVLSPIPVMKLPARYLTSLFAVPYYILWKLIIGIGRKPRGWIRTPREPQTPA